MSVRWKSITTVYIRIYYKSIKHIKFIFSSSKQFYFNLFSFIQYYFVFQRLMIVIVSMHLDVFVAFLFIFKIWLPITNLIKKLYIPVYSITYIMDST